MGRDLTEREVRGGLVGKGAGGGGGGEGGLTTGGVAPIFRRETDRPADDVGFRDVTPDDVIDCDVMRRDVTFGDAMAGPRGKGGGGGRTEGVRPTMAAAAMVVGAAGWVAGTEEEVRAEEREDTAVRGKAAEAVREEDAAKGAASKL